MRPIAFAWPKRCGCGRVHFLFQWKKLDELPDWDFGNGEVYETRNCQCGSTILVPVEAVRRAA
jgi:hypothetical protein